MRLPKALTIAGSDSGGGAGIQADLHTFSALGVYGASVITSVTAQNTVEVSSIYDLPPDLVSIQIETVLRDIGTHAVKTGMLSNAGIIEAVAFQIQKQKIRNYVLDPVMISKSRAPLLRDDAVEAMMKKLIPLALVVTPNIPEAERLTGLKIDSLKEMESAAMKILALGAKVVIVKGGHLKSDAVDVMVDKRSVTYLRARRIATKHTHGTGCTFSAAIAAGLARKMSPLEAARNAKRFVTQAIRHSLNVGKGPGPLGHAYRLWSRLQ